MMSMVINALSAKVLSAFIVSSGTNANTLKKMINNNGGNTKSMCIRYIHKSSALYLNRFLFDPSELDDDTPLPNDSHGNSIPPVPVVTLPKNDYRTIHAAKTLGLQNNDTIRAGVVLDNFIELKTTFNNTYNQTVSSGMIPKPSLNSELYGGMITDEASITWIPEGKIKKAEPTKNGDPPGSLRITLHSLEPYNDSSSQIDESSQISILLALPRPLALGRLLPMISMMGVSNLILTSAQKVPKDYFGSHLFRNPNEIRKLLIEGLCQAGDVRIPSVTVVNRLKPFLEDDLDHLFPPDEWARVIAHPLRKQDSEHDTNLTNNQSFLMNDVKFPSSTLAVKESSSSKILLAVGPEGGWSEPYELDLFQDHGFQQVTLGSRILRSDVAVVSLLSLARDVCVRRSMK